MWLLNYFQEMSQENVCLLCNTENAKYDKDFLAQRAYFSAPKVFYMKLDFGLKKNKIFFLM